jgi:hypothetical protein
MASPRRNNMTVPADSVGLTSVRLVTFNLNSALSRFVTEQMSRLPELPVHRREVSSVDRPYALARRLGAVVIQEIVRCYESGASAAELAERYGVCHTGLKNRLHAQGAAVRSPRGLSSADVNLAERLYAAGWLLREIGAELRFSRDAVRRALLQRGVVMRSGYGSGNRSKRSQR